MNAFKLKGIFDISTLRSRLAWIFATISIILLVFSFLSLGLAWYYAFQHHMIPLQWDSYEGNHGPWRHFYQGRALTWWTLYFQLMSFLAALISILIKLTRVGIWMIIISILVFVVVFYFHYWLID
jgi:hypothetical protein